MIQGFRLSPQQEHLWLLQQLDPSPAYRSRCAVLIAGDLDRAALAAALAGLVARHEILRTRFEKPRGVERAAQAIGEPSAPLIRDVEVDDSGIEAAAERLFAELEQQPRDLAQGAPLIAALARLATGEHLLGLDLPALCCDGPGLRNVVAGLAQAYGGETAAAEPMQYADLAEWLNSLLESPEAAPGLDHWRRLDLSGLLAARLPSERHGSGMAGFAPRSVRRPLSAAVATGLAAAASRTEVPLPDFLLAAWQALLWQFLRQPECIVGLVAEGRSYEGLEGVPGLLARHLPVPVSLAPEDAFGAVARRAARGSAEALEWQEYFTWEPIRRATGNARGPFFFPFAFEVVDAPDAVAAGGASFTVLREEAMCDRFRWKLTVKRAGAEVRGLEIHYDSGLIDRGDAERLAGQLEILLAQVAADPETRLAELSILTPDEWRLLVADFNRTAAAVADDPLDVPAHQRFEEAAQRAPDAPAVIAGDGELTYAELAARAASLARVLQGLGVGPESLVGLAVDRSTAMAVGVLGILKTGAAYVPLDPGYPEERLAYMLRDAAVPVLVTRRELLATLPANTARIVDLDEAAGGDRADPPAAAVADPAPGNAAYVIYTSGSTGDPRGVVIEHGNLAHYVAAMGRQLALTAEDRYLHTASVAFSSSVRQLLVPLAHGAAVVIAGVEERRDPLALFALIARAGVTIIDLVPSHWRGCVNALAGLDPAARRDALANRLRLVLSASEPLLSDVPRAWRLELGGPGELVNMFGQTETTGIVATLPVHPQAGEPVRGVPIGRPIADTEIYILDEARRPAATGIAGRVYIGGRGIGRGYLGRPELTAERFVPHPLAAEPGSRLYDTGDVARFQADAGIELLGRSDFQVKIRGLRIELGEIEAALGQHPGVREAVVVARDEGAGGSRLIGYVVPRQRPAPSADGLRVFLAERLPEYMVPAAWVTLDAIPLTPNGKIDRRALPAPDRSRGASDADYVAPRDEHEARLAQIFAAILEIDRVGIHDNFFKLGGHSLLGTVLMSRVRDVFAVDLPVLRLFEAPTVAELARVVGREAAAESEEIPLLAVPPEDELLAAVDSLPGDQVQALLDRMLGEEEAFE